MIYNFTLIERLLLSKDILPHPVLDSLNLVVAGRALQVAVKLKIFEIMRTRSMSLNDISDKAEISHNGAQVLLDCLAVMGYISTYNGKYKLTSRAKKFLISGSNYTLSNMVLFSENVFESLLKLDIYIKQGGPKLENLEVFTKHQWDIFNKAMAEIASLDVKEVIGKIPFSQDYKRLLDLGGSHGIHSIESCKKVHNLYAEIMDLKPTKANAGRIIKENRMSKRVRFRAGDFLKDDLGGGHDVVLAFNVIHGLTTANNQKLANKVFKSMNQGGIYVILDQIKEARGKSDLARLIPATMGVMLFNQSGGRTYSLVEVEKWMENAGFRKVEFKKLRNPWNGIIIGHKA